MGRRQLSLSPPGPLCPSWKMGIRALPHPGYSGSEEELTEVKIDCRPTVDG